MEFTTRAEVSGMKKFKDTVEGKEYDTTKLFIKTDLDSSQGNAMGFATVEYQFNDSGEFDKLKHLPFPFEADITIELVTTGKVQKQRVKSIKPLAMVPGKAEK